jgi:hypothetical protein
MEKKQTAVEWLEELLHFECKYSLNNEVIINYDVLDNIIMKAKQMEKEQICNSHNIKKKEKQEEKRSKEFSEWFNEAWDKSINSQDNHAEDWN